MIGLIPEHPVHLVSFSSLVYLMMRLHPVGVSKFAKPSTRSPGVDGSGPGERWPIPRGQSCCDFSSPDGYSIGSERMVRSKMHSSEKWPRVSGELRLGSVIGSYTTNMVTPAVNIATVVTATTIHPKRELGWELRDG